VKRYAVVLRAYMVAALAMSVGLLVKASAPPLPVVGSADVEVVRAIKLRRPCHKANEWSGAPVAHLRCSVPVWPPFAPCNICPYIAPLTYIPYGFDLLPQNPADAAHNDTIAPALADRTRASAECGTPCEESSK
jgi:hypothetical protein